MSPPEDEQIFSDKQMYRDKQIYLNESKHLLCKIVSMGVLVVGDGVED